MTRDSLYTVFINAESTRELESVESGSVVWNGARRVYHPNGEKKIAVSAI